MAEAGRLGSTERLPATVVYPDDEDTPERRANVAHEAIDMCLSNFPDECEDALPIALTFDDAR